MNAGSLSTMDIKYYKNCYPKFLKTGNSISVEFPPTFDVKYYKDCYPELQDLPDDIVEEHHRLYAEAQGRTSCIYDRSEYLTLVLNDMLAENPLNVLEIISNNNPTGLGRNVKYFDVSKNDLQIVNEKFDIVFSSHCIERQPDLIRHFQNVEKILNTGGIYILVISDKRYSSNYYRNETTFFETIDAYVNANKRHTFKNLAETNCLQAHDTAMVHWLGMHGPSGVSQEKFVNMLSTYAQNIQGGGYVDAQAWCFTPNVFDSIVTNLYNLQLIHMNVHRLCHTIWGRAEFCCILKKN